MDLKTVDYIDQLTIGDHPEIMLDAFYYDLTISEISVKRGLPLFFIKKIIDKGIEIIREDYRKGEKWEDNTNHTGSL